MHEKQDEMAYFKNGMKFKEKKFIRTYARLEDSVQRHRKWQASLDKVIKVVAKPDIYPE
jgi:hypothetical protein